LVPIANVTDVVESPVSTFPYVSWTATAAEKVPVPVAGMLAPEAGCVVNASLVAAPGEFVAVKFVDVAPVAAAVIEYPEPATVLAVNVPALAWPPDAVVAVVVAVEFANVPDAPLEGAVNVTVTPGTGFPWASLTIATSWLANAVPTVAVWPEPETVVTLLAGP
jgi:hypothetical protein